MKRIPQLLLLLSVALAAGAFVSGQSKSASSRYRGWSAYGGGPEQMRYSSLTQINRTNVAQLERAWTYDSGESGGLQTQPIVAEGVLYAYTPTQKTFALRADTGEHLWTFDPHAEGRGPNRGLMYWSSGGERRVFAAVDQYLYALDASTGKPIDTFGDRGRIDLRADLGRDPREQSVRLTSPGVVYKDMLIIGGRVNEGLPASPGDIRAYDVRTGKLRWSFHTIPHPGEFGYETWSKDSWTINGGANSWPGMALDEARGVVYAPTGSAAADFYGANRIGDNVFANSLIALDANTGTRLWHFQFVRHDIWDRDLPSPPTLATLNRNGRSVDAVVQTTKHGYVFVFDRKDGKPLFPIEEKKYPTSSVPGEVTAQSQPIPAAPKPFARQLLTKEMLTTRTPEAHQWAVDQFSTFRSDGPFVPFAVGKDTIIFPGYDGGAEWGGQAFDPETALFYVNANDLAWTGALAPNDAGQSSRTLYLQNCAACHRDDRVGAPPQIPSLIDVGQRKSRQELATIIRQGGGRMPGFAYMQRPSIDALIDFLTTGEDRPAPPSPAAAMMETYRFTGYKKFLDPEGYPAVAPPWGTLNAINLNTGQYAWTVPFGEYPELAANGMKDTGKLLWETTLPFSGNGTPAIYEVNGRQFVVIAAGGGKDRPGKPSGGVYCAFALPVNH